MNAANPIEAAMSERIQAQGDGWVFSPVHFVDLGTRLQPAGADAANLLRLSDQALAKVVFLSDDRKQLLKDLAYAPAWIALIMRKLATLG